MTHIGSFKYITASLSLGILFVLLFYSELRFGSFDFLANQLGVDYGTLISLWFSLFILSSVLLALRGLWDVLGKSNRNLLVVSATTFNLLFFIALVLVFLVGLR